MACRVTQAGSIPVADAFYIGDIMNEYDVKELALECSQETIDDVMNCTKDLRENEELVKEIYKG